jgi:hypothetical protein
MTIEIQNMWLEEKDYEGISFTLHKVWRPKAQGDEVKWNLDMES